MNGYQDLQVWQKAVDFITYLYRCIGGFPKEERYALADQMKRAAVSIASNITEGYARKSMSDYIRFLRMAYGSGMEVETQIIIAQRIGYLSEDTYNTLSEQISEMLRMLNGLIAALEKKSLRPES